MFKDRAFPFAQQMYSMKPVAWLFGNRIVFTVYGTTAADAMYTVFPFYAITYHRITVSSSHIPPFSSVSPHPRGGRLRSAYFSWIAPFLVVCILVPVLFLRPVNPSLEFSSYKRTVDARFLSRSASHSCIFVCISIFIEIMFFEFLIKCTC